MDILIL